MTEPHAAGYAGALAICGHRQCWRVPGDCWKRSADYMTDATSGAVVLNEALKYPCLDNAVVTGYKACDVGASGLTGDDYPAGYSKGILLTATRPKWVRRSGSCWLSAPVELARPTRSSRPLL